MKISRLLILSVCALIAVGCASPSHTTTPSKRELVKAVLSELGVAARFDGYLVAGADRSAGGTVSDPKTHQWLQELWVQELGWTKCEDAYIAHFESKFSDTELQELMVLSKSPTVRKLLEEELAAYRSTFDLRNKVFSTFWHRYNSLEFRPPAAPTE